MQIAIADEYPQLLAGVTADEVCVERLQGPGAILDCGYALFERIFDPSVLDSKDTYVDRMSKNASAARDFLPCFTIAYVERKGYRLIAGFLSADVMWLAEPDGGAMLAVGNVGTSKHLKEIGLRGVGTKLLDASIEIASREVAQDGRRLLCVAAEAEPASLGFWKKRGFLWPEGCNYLQPPLEWDAAGNPVHVEVPETLLLAPVEMPGDKVKPSLVRSVIVAIYENWCLRGWRDSLSPGAFHKAEAYVMTRVLGKVMQSMPTDPMALTKEF